MSETIAKHLPLSIDHLLEIMDAVEADTLSHGSDDLAYNAASNAASELFLKLKDAVRLVSEYGQEKLEEALESVVTEWASLREQLGEAAGETLSLFQGMMQSLIAKAIETIAQSFPMQLKSGAVLDTIAFQSSVALSPSVSFSTTEWLKIAATGGFHVSTTYRFPPESI